jgi:hypothetical protein
VDRRHRDDLGQAGLLEAVPDRLPRGLGGVALSPGVLREPVADLDRRGEVGGKRLVGEAGEADERARGDLFRTVGGLTRRITWQG